MEINALERHVMEMLLAGEHPTLLILRDQFRVAHVINRKLTGVGFLTAFLIPPEAPRLLGSKSLRLDDVTAVIDRLQHGAGFVLFTKHGAIDVLKGFSFDEPWVESIERFQLSYMGSPTRDPSVLSQELQD